MNRIRTVNYIRLQSEAELDSICFAEEALMEGECSPFAQYSDELLMKAKREAGSSENHFIEYNWNGYGLLPWNESHGIEFDPGLVSIIVPETGTTMHILGEGRRVLLTLPPMYKGREPVYAIKCTSPRQWDYIRILPNRANPFRGIDKAFGDIEFRSLPKLSESGVEFLLNEEYKEVIIPSSTKTFF